MQQPQTQPKQTDTETRFCCWKKKPRKEMTGLVMVSSSGVGGGENVKSFKEKENQHHQLCLLDLLLAALRKSMMFCQFDQKEVEVKSTVHPMEIGWPTNVQHLTHVTFDRFHGFLGLPLEFEVEIPCKVPSASISVFGISAESMQCSFDTRGNSVPTILLLMQEQLYLQGGLKAEGIFRINPENSQEEKIRDQLNRGIVPDDMNVHCLAGLIKAWFRELPAGVLDGLSPEQVLQCNTEEEFIELVKQLKPTEIALLKWAIDLMADVVEQEESNKMNARNIAMVFAPNMTQMSDPLTALVHAVQVMNLLKTLIVKTLRERGETEGGGEYSPMSSSFSDRQTEKEFGIQQEMETRCESTGPASDDDEQPHYSYSSEDRDDIESLSEIEGSFLRQVGENDRAKNDFRKQLQGILCSEHNPTSASTFNGDSKNGNSGLSTGNSEDSRATSVSVGRRVQAD
ncbi:rho GTPase-activating protein 2-like [Lycium barbarum]|uniref:rho GTPase-activating protein 2-like n=1 Tax=Lycium barbarum TaxID=112863 RepID=UPI00293EC266|nr:rho GTPase-activating protein 2-like [Lycium barbarum]